jgi:hypothetical protein
LKGGGGEVVLDLAERIGVKQEKYRRFLERKIRVYRMWQSFSYYSTLYLKLYNETSEYLIQFLLLDDLFFECDEAVLNLLDNFLEQLVKAYNNKLHEDFDKGVFFEEYTSKVN